MSAGSPTITAVPTNIITGFLGVGKTTAILHLLKGKPADQRWAVLVNEFGEIGVDGSLMGGQQGSEQQVFIQEVPGGCMCCAAGLPMQVALNQLLAASHPDRVLIEPTGLGHPKEVLQVLTGGPYRKALNVQRTVTLVDARQFNDQRYTESLIFNQQIEVADVVVANKADLYQPEDKDRLHAFIQEKELAVTEVVFTSYGEIDDSLLTGGTEYPDQSASAHSSHDHHHHSVPSGSNTLPDCGYLKKLNQGDGYQSVGWRFREDMVFDRQKLFSLLSGISAERVKGVMNTEDGPWGYNFAAGSLTQIQLFSRGQSCIEIICDVVDENWESQLLQCLENDAAENTTG